MIILGKKKVNKIQAINQFIKKDKEEAQIECIVQLVMEEILFIHNGI